MGSTRWKSSLPASRRDHPHIHGEHSFRLRCRSRPRGSPPYTWGALVNPDGAIRILRITPIYMGSTLKQEDYNAANLGSPPYTWGAH